MQIQAYVALVAAAFAVGGLELVQICCQPGSQADRCALFRESNSDEARTRALIARYCKPLLRSAQNLQSRLHDILYGDYLLKYCRGSVLDRAHAVHSTLYMVGEYLAYVETIRRQLRVLDSYSVEQERKLANLLEQVTRSFSTQTLESTFRLLRAQQAIIGNIMQAAPYMVGDKGSGPIGVDEFCTRLYNAEFSQWFVHLQEGIELLAAAPAGHEERLFSIQHALLQLIAFLSDPSTEK